MLLQTLLQQLGLQLTIHMLLVNIQLHTLLLEQMAVQVLLLIMFLLVQTLQLELETPVIQISVPRIHFHFQ